ncbi:MAG: PilT/PilU family type 4a pilus ATPase [Oscillospiraceae bacterium]
MISIDELIRDARAEGCSDIHLSLDLPPVFRFAGRLVYKDYATTSDDIKRIIFSLMSNEQMTKLSSGLDVDFCYETPDGLRHRVNVFHEGGRICAAIRILNDTIPSIEQLGLPPVLKQLAMLPRGLVLVTGPTGSGKSTTLAAMIDYVNQHKLSHIITIEDPIEYKYAHKKAMIHQREIGEDVDSFASALRSSLREDPDVILVGEMRDFETISAAITAAETGHLVFSTLHTTGAANTIDRIVDVFHHTAKGRCAHS